MPMGSKHVVTGRLMETGRGLILQVDGGGEYELDAGRAARRLLGHRVTVHGTRSGFNRLDVEWISAEGMPRG